MSSIAGLCDTDGLDPDIDNERHYIAASLDCARHRVRHTALNDPNKFVPADRWESLEAMPAHDHSPLIAAANARSGVFRAGPATMAVSRAILRAKNARIGSSTLDRYRVLAVESKSANAV